MQGAARDGDNAARAGQPAEARPRLAVIIGGQPGDLSECRIDDPDRVMRAWFLLVAAEQELHQVSLSPGAESRLGQQLHAVTAELERSLSPALTAELRRLRRVNGSPVPTLAELRTECASLAGWTGGLVTAMLGQLEEASARRGVTPEPGAGPDH